MYDVKIVFTGNTELYIQGVNDKQVAQLKEAVERGDNFYYQNYHLKCANIAYYHLTEAPQRKPSTNPNEYFYFN
ncbi:hypothetical protein [Paenibacillus dauci]|uniref:hypothetical protein n=1 Tax=Paenibacillus dauci TaxID=1567106 RepID=UPI000619DB04|nr:hypothetical protein [Paenibacillus dauci]